jgi:hypothetical protein
MKALDRKRRFTLSRKCLPESAAFRFPESACQKAPLSALRKAIMRSLSAFQKAIMLSRKQLGKRFPLSSKGSAILIALFSEKVIGKRFPNRVLREKENSALPNPPTLPLAALHFIHDSLIVLGF